MLEVGRGTLIGCYSECPLVVEVLAIAEPSIPVVGTGLETRDDGQCW